MAATRKRGTVSLADAISDEVADQAGRPGQEEALADAGPPAATQPPAPPQPAAPAPRAGARREEQPRPAPAWDARMSLTLSKDMKRALDIARADDGIEGTARIRAMIDLWQNDERLRRRIDKMARDFRERPPARP